MSNSAHIVWNLAYWQVKVNGAVVASERTKDDCIRRGREYLQRNGGGELVIHNLDGQISSKDTIYPGNDPRNIKG